MPIYLNDREVVFGTYPNGELVVPKLGLVRNYDRGSQTQDVRLHWETDHDLVKLALVRGYLRDSGFKDADLIIDYLPYSRMDRAQNGHCFSLKWIAQLIDAMDWREVILVEPHSPVSVEQFVRARAIYPTMTLLPKVMEWTQFVQGRDVLVLPDAGAATRYESLAPELFATNHLVVLKKKRDFETGQIGGVEIDYAVIRGVAADPARQAIIIDDLSSRGGTFVLAQQELRRVLGLEKVHLLVTHMEPAGLRGALRYELDRVFHTDTMTQPRPLPDNFHCFDRSAWL